MRERYCELVLPHFDVALMPKVQMKIKLIACFLLLTSTLLADQPKAIINGKTSAPAPGVLILDSTGSVHDFGDQGVAWDVTDEDIQLMEGKDGRLALFYMGTKPIKGKAILWCWGNVNGTPVPSRLSVPISFGGDLPNPPIPVPPGPNPPGPTPIPPGPAPSPIDDGKYKLAKLAFDSGMTVIQPNRAKAQEIARAFGDTANAIRANKFGNAVNFREVMVSVGTYHQALINTILPTPADKKPWDGFQNVNARVNILSNTGQINTPADLAIAFDEIAVGLGNVK